MIKERCFTEDIMLGPIKFYGKTVKFADNPKFLNEINKNDNETKFFTEPQHNEQYLTILGNMIYRVNFASGGRTKPAITFFNVPLKRCFVGPY